MRQQKVSQITIRNAHKAYMDDVSPEDLAARFGMSYSMMLKRFRKEGLPLKTAGKKYQADPGSGRPA